MPTSLIRLLLDKIIIFPCDNKMLNILFNLMNMVVKVTNSLKTNLFVCLETYSCSGYST